MSYNLEFAIRVAFDINKAFVWYEKQKSGLGVELISEIEACYKKPELQPESYSVTSKRSRRIKTERFPYMIIYNIKENTVYVTRVIHASRMKK